ncbi:hypothetical protein [Limibacillus halophilus]|uniref:Uncharacterized protein n=1 Tax=Limibacillus halophilus TaxID=1579333 RepID=A0A839SV82_9PROT|nr:hypothetical protein [Limibacillus halophilus]MBB3066711.1 hypothetical protein [Limibacillus halophilus]
MIWRKPVDRAYLFGGGFIFCYLLGCAFTLFLFYATNGELVADMCTIVYYGEPYDLSIPGDNPISGFYCQLDLVLFAVFSLVHAAIFYFFFLPAALLLYRLWMDSRLSRNAEDR